MNAASTDAPRVAVLFGGASVEHEVSVSSARGVLEALVETSLTGVPLGVDGHGRWLTPGRTREVLDSGASRVPDVGPDEPRCALEPGGGRVLRVASAEGPRAIPVDVVFPLLHGRGGEDGRLQGALDGVGLPCVGAGVLGSALCMDKAVAKRILASHEIPVVPWLQVEFGEWERGARQVADSVGERLGYPLFVKPANGGSSVGVSRVAAPEALGPALARAFDCDPKVVVERAVNAREIECGVIGNASPEASVAGEIFPSREFYDYEAKYEDGTSKLEIPARLSAPEAERLARLACSAYRALEVRGYARVDFLVDREDGTPFLNEINTLPGFTPISMFSKVWEVSGLAYPRLLERLVELAFDRWRADRSVRTRRKEG